MSNPAYANEATINTIIRLRQQHSYREIATLLNMEQVPAATGGKWHASTVRRVHKRAVSERCS